MKMLICVLNRVEKLEPVLQNLERDGFIGATVISSCGMAMALNHYFSGSFLGSLHAIMEPDREENKTLFMVLKDDQVKPAVKCIEAIAGSFDTPNSGIAFAVPVDFVKGIADVD